MRRPSTFQDPFNIRHLKYVFCVSPRFLGVCYGIVFIAQRYKKDIPGNKYLFALVVSFLTAQGGSRVAVKPLLDVALYGKRD